MLCTETHNELAGLPDGLPAQEYSPAGHGLRVKTFWLRGPKSFEPKSSKGQSPKEALLVLRKGLVPKHPGESLGGYDQ